MKKTVYRERKTFYKFDSKHIIGFLNETVLENYQPDSQDAEEPIGPFTAYQYEGPDAGGGTVMECTDPTSRDDIVNAIIRTRYTVSQEMAIHRHHSNDPAGYGSEWDEYDAWCEKAKAIADTWLAGQ
ncbi:MAG: hypothetical protein IJK46_05890 [Prevotella sp.]|nr:hypothetical protein [Prevotella sp.]